MAPFHHLIDLILPLVQISSALAHPTLMLGGPHSLSSGNPVPSIRPLLVSPTILLPVSAPSPPPRRITCFKEGIRTTVSTCRPTLNYFRTFPNYRLIQAFQENKSPKAPDKPPLYLYVKASDCAVGLASGNPHVVDWFSYENVRALATEIVEECQDEGGFGGWSPIGRSMGWHVRIVGYDGKDVEPDGPALLFGTSAGGNVSSGTSLLEKASS